MLAYHLFLPRSVWIPELPSATKPYDYSVVPHQVKDCTVLGDQRCLSWLITTVRGTANATPAQISLYSQCKRLKWGSMWDCKRGHARPSQPWAWRYTFTEWHGTLWLSLCRRVGTQKAGGGGAACVWRGKTAHSNGEKRAISNQVRSAAQFATGQNTSVIRFLVTIFPNLHGQCSP